LIKFKKISISRRVILNISTFFAQTIQLNLRAFNLTMLSYIKDCLTCFAHCLIKNLKNKKLQYLIFEKYLF